MCYPLKIKTIIIIMIIIIIIYSTKAVKVQCMHFELCESAVKVSWERIESTTRTL